MNTEQAWTNLVDCFFLKCHGESWLELKDAINAYTDLAVTEARAPLVEILEDLQWQAHDEPYDGADLDPPITSVTVFSCPECGGLMDIGHFGDCQLAAALAKETPDA